MTAEAALSLVNEGLVTVSEATGIARVGKTTLYEAMAAGQLPYVKIGASRRIPRRALDMWMARHLVISGERVFDGEEGVS